MAKTKDLFLNIIANPTMTLEDFASVGLTSENTMLLDRAQYASNEKVQNMFKDANGNFDEAQFNLAYDLAVQNYNILATDEANLNLLNVTAYDQDNIFVDPSRRRQKNEPFITKLPNPDRLNVGVTRIGKIGPRTLSQDEIAQTQQVLLNPTKVAKGAKPIYGKTPNESWFEDFWDTRVMAAWDEDGTHIDPVTGLEVQHQKGDLKLNENGTYYYENLDGRSVYGKRILNKFNTLTTDGSSWNKYDFFDSDDIEQKSIGGSVVKNLALVGSMFIPYVGWGIAAASVAHQMAGLTATFGKMLVGADNEALNNLEGWVKSTDRRNLKTEYAQQNMWCWENFIDLVGDTAAQLREQRAIFKFVPGIIKGDFKAINEKAMQKYTQDLAQEYMDNATKLSLKDIIKLAKEKNPTNWKEQVNLMLKGASDVFTEKAKKAAQDYVTNYYKLGEPIAKAYMTAITVQDMFGEAIEAGASNNEATLLTLGYAAAEAALLSTDLGKWIMPELRTEKLRMKTIAKKLFELSPETRNMSEKLSQLSGETKKQWVKRLFNIGKDICTAEYSTMAKTAGTVLAQGLGEGIEEVSEELLADFSKSCFNLVKHLQGDDVRMSAWEDMGNRYAMSFAGGILGGGINAAASDYKANRELTNMNSQQAMQQIVYMTRNGKMDDFWKVVDKTTLASKELSTKMNEDGTYKPGTKDDNQDLEAKRFLRQQIGHIESIINAENAKLDDNGLLATLINADPSLKDMDPVKEYRMRALANSATAGRLLNEWNTIVSDITKNRLDQATIMSKYGDENSEKYSEEDKQTLKEKQKQLKELQKRKEAILNGERTREYVRDALFEMSPAMRYSWDKFYTEVRYAETKTGKKYNDIAEDQKQKLKEEYNTWVSSNETAEKVHEMAEMYEALAVSTSNAMQASAEFYEKLKQGDYQNIKELNNLVQERFRNLQFILSNPENGLAELQKVLLENHTGDLTLFNGSDTLFNALQTIQDQVNADIDVILNGRNLSDLTSVERQDIANKQIFGKVEASKKILELTFDKISKTFDEFIKAGFIHPETKLLLGNFLQTLKDTAYSEFSQALYIGNDALADLYEEQSNQLFDKLQQLDTLSNTPIIENLKQFQLSTTSDQSTLDLITYLQQQEQKNIKDITEFQLDKVTLDQFENAKHLLELYRAAIVGARYDAVDIDNIVGFNTTLNELSGESKLPKLAEIDAQTADLVLEDIKILLDRLDYAEQIHKLNTGNKYNIQNKTAINKQFILYNKIKQFISTLQDDDEWKDEDGESELTDLYELVNNKATTFLTKAGTGSYETRRFDLTPEEKTSLEKESIEIQTALHKFLNKHIDGSQASIDKLAKLLTYDNFKGLIRANNEFLNQSSEDIDDSAFIWWLCATAALDPHQFYNNYRYIIGEETEGEKPIAPIATQELGVFALTASIVNGNMFKIFGKALRQSLVNIWENSDPTTRKQINIEYGGQLLVDDEFKPIWKNNDFLPNFDNILFIEGIAGSGKSTGVLKSWSKLMAKANPDFVNQAVIFAHTDKDKAQSLADSTSFTDVTTHDHNSLLLWMSQDYTPANTLDGNRTYVKGKDVNLYADGILRSNWEVRALGRNDIPKVIIIDEWSHYDQIEQELIQRFAQTYGVTVIAMGDYDQLTPETHIKESETATKDWLDLSPSRNMTARIAKLGVSMRTDNEIKNGNMYRLLAWRQSPSSQMIEMHYYEDETGIYGDKNYRVSTSYGNQLDSIKLDVQKMISTLKEGEKIGYIYSDINSELYQWLTSTVGVKEHIQPYLEKDAHGREAQYYIVENDRTEQQDALTYFRSLYTGVTRSEQGSIIISNTQKVTNETNTAYNNAGIELKTVKDSDMIPNTFTDAGTRDFANKRKIVFDDIFGSEAVTPFQIKPRTPEEVSMDLPASTGSSATASTTGSSTTSSSTTSTSTSTSTSTTTSPASSSTSTFSSTSSSSSAASTSPAPTSSSTSSISTSSSESSSTSEELPLSSDDWFDSLDLTDIPPERTDEENNIEQPWEGPLNKGQLLYNSQGIANYAIEGEEIAADGTPMYRIRKIDTETIESQPKSNVHNKAFLTTSKDAKLLNVGDELSDRTNKFILKRIFLDGPKDNPYWTYEFDNGQMLTQPQLQTNLNNKTFIVHQEIIDDPSLTPPIVAEYEMDGQSEFEAVAEEEVFNRPSEQITQQVGVTAENDLYFDLLGYTFNTFYTADHFDKHGNIIIDPQYDSDRIDNGYGLYGINPQKYRNKAQMFRDLGILRRHLEFSDNGTICTQVSRLTGLQIGKMEWAFISKTKDGKRTDQYKRFNYPSGELEFMMKEEGRDIPVKMISAVFFDINGNAVLEIPMLVFQSPHSIFHEFEKRGIAADILNIWYTRQQHVAGETERILREIIEHIKTTYPNKPGYQNLSNLLTLWLFSSNDVRFLPESWNLHASNKNLGNIYVKSREADDRPDYNYVGIWKDLTEHARSDRFISSIMMNNSEQKQVGTKLVTLFRPYVPYVFISDDPSITNDDEAAQRWLAQEVDPTLEKTVKIYPVSPPQVSVQTYIEGMWNVLTNQSTNEPYGNKYTPYRIWQSILQSSDRNEIMQALKEEDRDKVITMVNRLNEIKNQNPIQEGESKLDYKRRLAEKQNEYIDSKIDSQHSVSELLRKYLLETCMYQQMNTDVRGDQRVMDLITKAYNEMYQQDYDVNNKAGILCKPRFAPGQHGNEIGGFAYKVQTSGQFNYPGQGSFRIYAKIDPPTYDITSMLEHISDWAKQAVQGFKIYNKKTKTWEIRDKNVWHFSDKFASEKYLMKDAKIEPYKMEYFTKTNETLDKLGLSQYHIEYEYLAQAESKSQAQQMMMNWVRDAFLNSENGTFIINVNGHWKFGNLHTAQTSEFANYKFQRSDYTSDQYILTFIDLATNQTKEIAIELDLTNNAFKVVPETANTSLNIAEIKQEILNEFNQSLYASDQAMNQLITNILTYYNDQTNSVDMEQVKTLLDNSTLDPFTRMTVEITLKLDQLTQNQDQQCINPISIPFKL